MSLKIQYCARKLTDEWHNTKWPKPERVPPWSLGSDSWRRAKPATAFWKTPRYTSECGCGTPDDGSCTKCTSKNNRSAQTTLTSTRRGWAVACHRPTKSFYRCFRIFPPEKVISVKDLKIIKFECSSIIMIHKLFKYFWCEITITLISSILLS